MELEKEKKKFIKNDIWYLVNINEFHCLNIYPVKIFEDRFEYDENDDCVSVYGKDGVILVRPRELFKNVTLQAAR